MGRRQGPIGDSSGTLYSEEARYESDNAQQGLLQKQMDQLHLQQQTQQELYSKELQMLKDRVSKSERLLLLLSEEVERLDSPSCSDLPLRASEQVQLEPFPEKGNGEATGANHFPGRQESQLHTGQTHFPLHVTERHQSAPSSARVKESSDEENTVKKTPPRVSEYRPTGFLRIVEVNPSGRFVRVSNSSRVEEADLSGCVIQQWVGGHPVSLFRFPPSTGLPPLQHITIWASAAAEVSHEPPRELLWKEQLHFRTGPECTTLLTRPGGQPIDWYRTPHRVYPAPCQNEEGQRCQEVQLQRYRHSEEPASRSPPSDAIALCTPREDLAEPALLRHRESPLKTVINNARTIHTLTDIFGETRLPGTAEAKPRVLENRAVHLRDPSHPENGVVREEDVAARHGALTPGGPDAVEEVLSGRYEVSPGIRSHPPSSPPDLEQSSWNAASSEAVENKTHPQSRATGSSERRSQPGSISAGSASTTYSFSFLDGISGSSSRLPSSLGRTTALQTRLNTRSPVVALIAQKSARSKYGFKFLSYPPFTADVHVIRR